MDNMNNTENKYEELSEDADELIEIDKLSSDESLTEELLALDGAESEEDAAVAQKSDELITVVGVRFKNTGKVYYFSPKGMTFENGENVVVDTSRGMEYGTVCMPNREVHTGEIVLPVREVLRRATAEDTARRRKNEDLEITAFNTFIERIDAHGLEMKLIDVECAFDNSKLLFYFSAESRIDFRELVRELAGIFHTRIELRQIGIRDEAKMLGGLGICGRPFCCSSFLSDFVQVSIKMAKEQNLSLNAAKISGACGKLMCCLRYEYESYLAEKAITPKVGAEVMTPDGEGVVSDANPMTGIVKVKLAGTAEDDSPVLFIRDDVVLKENYNGEKLIKTPIPAKRNPVAPVSSFEVRSPFADRVEESVTEPDTKLKSEGKDKKKRDNRSRAEASQTERRADSGADVAVDGGKNGGKDKGKNGGRGDRPDRGDRFDKNGRFGKNGGHGKGGKPAHATSADGADEGARRDHGNKNGDQGKGGRPQQKPFPPKNQGGEKPAENLSTKREGKPSEGGKKPYKPFYRKGKGHGGNGGNSGNGGN